MTGARLISGVSAGVLALSAASSAEAATTIKAASGPLTATMAATGHAPKVNVKWPITVTATISGKPVHASALYEFVFGGSVVSTTYPRSNKHFSFTGHFSDQLLFPAASAGEPLTLRVVVKAAGRTVNLNWAVDAKK